MDIVDSTSPKWESRIAHRCNTNNSVPENTLAALNKAHSLNFKWVECDVNITKDGVLIIMHDDTLRRTTDAPEEIRDLPIAELNFAEIEKCHAGIHYKGYENEKVPTLTTFLEQIKKYDMGLLLEIKPSKGVEIETTRKILECLREMGLLQSEKLLVQSFLVETLREAKKIVPSLNLGLIVERWNVYTREKHGDPVFDDIYLSPDSVLDVLQELNCVALVANEELINKERITKVKEITSSVLCWTVNDINRARELFDLGVDAMISDYPERIQFANQLRTISFFNQIANTNSVELPSNINLHVL